MPKSQPRCPARSPIKATPEHLLAHPSLPLKHHTSLQKQSRHLNPRPTLKARRRRRSSSRHHLTAALCNSSCLGAPYCREKRRQPFFPLVPLLALPRTRTPEQSSAKCRGRPSPVTSEPYRPHHRVPRTILFLPGLISSKTMHRSAEIGYFGERRRRIPSSPAQCSPLACRPRGRATTRAEPNDQGRRIGSNGPHSNEPRL